jgi:hypothetical protein
MLTCASGDDALVSSDSGRTSLATLDEVIAELDR